MWNLYWTWHIISRFMGCKLFPKGWKICAVWKLNSRFWILITWFDGADKGDGAVLRLDLWINTCDDSHLPDCIRTIHQLRMCVIWCALLVQCVCVCVFETAVHKHLKFCLIKVSHRRVAEEFFFFEVRCLHSFLDSHWLNYSAPL